MSANPFDTPGGGSPADAAGAGESAPTPPAKKSPYKSQMARANVALVLLFIGGVAGVYGLTLRKGPAQASAEQQLAEAQVDSAIVRLSAAPDPRAPKKAAGSVTRKLLRNFCAEIKDRQVPASGLSKDPFVFIRPPQQAARHAAKQTEPEPAEKAADPTQETLADVTEKFERLELQSIMKGRGGRATAIISNNLVTAGQKVSVFTVKSIQPKAVILTWKDQQFTLEMPFRE